MLRVQDPSPGKKYSVKQNPMLFIVAALHVLKSLSFGLSLYHPVVTELHFVEHWGH